MMRPCLAAALLIFLAAPAAQAAMFDGLFAFTKTTSTAPLPDDSTVQVPDVTLLGPRTDAGVCIAAIRKAEAAHGIPADLLLAIGLQEAGMSYQGSMTIWPWSLNVEGRGIRFDTRAEAEAFLSGELAQSRRSIDVGCLQINLRWHPGAFPSPQAGFDPAQNADYAARFLRSLYLETGDWLEATGRYHSATPHLKDIYLLGIEQHLARLDRNAGSFDALAEQGYLPQDGISLAAGVTLTSVARTMNPLHAPVRQAATLAAGRTTYRRTLLVLARTPDEQGNVVTASSQGGTGWANDDASRGGSLFAPRQANENNGASDIDGLMP